MSKGFNCKSISTSLVLHQYATYRESVCLFLPLCRRPVLQRAFTFPFSAVWYDQTSYPTSWQLDPTEGPNRERRRLQRCYLTIPNKYLLKDRRKHEGERPPRGHTVSRRRFCRRHRSRRVSLRCRQAAAVFPV